MRFLLRLIVATAPAVGAHLSRAAEPAADVRLVLTDALIIAAPPQVREGEPEPTYAIMWPKITILIQNTSNRTITVPTRTFPDGGPNGSSHSSSDMVEWIYYTFALSRAGDFVLQPSESSFAPVTLNPGEVALLAHWQSKFGFSSKVPPHQLKKKFIYEVTADLAGKFGWWSGKAEANWDFRATPQMPNKSPEPTPTAVTPRASDRNSK